MANQPTTHPLFGGAITTSLPTGYLDASTMRDIPDTQEVFLDPNSNTNIIISLLERVTTITSNNSNNSDDHSALQTHFQDMYADETDKSGNRDTANVLGVRNLPIPPGTSNGGTVTAYILTAWMATADAARQEQRERGREEVLGTGVVMGLVRLENVKTDVLVCVNVPRAAADGELGETALGDMLGPAVGMVEEAVARMDVKDWGLFGES
ncbi:Mog1p/PsbP-like protein [Microthyrium microscopicum]|uniref:Mog1p/PsbP-like protein n=1 Tax=Microthyrium microscopicum TaxID=703497 RepID=A0A6A6U580_9PEZI|nr:Mog1p/PsbP-like protein [Microthyrium microscopicum]